MAARRFQGLWVCWGLLLLTVTPCTCKKTSKTSGNSSDIRSSAPGWNVVKMDKRDRQPLSSSGSNHNFQ